MLVAAHEDGNENLSGSNGDVSAVVVVCSLDLFGEGARVKMKEGRRDLRKM
jgi:hypothetical protein